MPSPEESLSRAAQFVANGQHAAAIALLRPIVTSPTHGANASYLLACAQFYSGDPINAEPHFRGLLEKGHQRSNCAYYLGEISLQRKARAMAICFFSGSITFNPTHRGALERLQLLGAAPKSATISTNPPQQKRATSLPPRPARFHNSVIGIVEEVGGPTAVPTWAGPATAQQIDIQFQQYDHSGVTVGPGYAYMRGIKIKGAVKKGNWIELIEKPAPDGRVRKLYNITTNTDLSSKSSILFPGS